MAKSARRSPRKRGDLIEIPLTMGKVALVDHVDFPLAQMIWTARKAPKADIWYASRKDECGMSLQLHREVAARMGLDVYGFLVDHKDRDGLNCVRSNLRLATPSQNQQNSTISRNNTSGTKGVAWHKGLQKWVARISINGKVVHLGVFDELSDAAEARAQAAPIYHGEFARMV